MQSALRPYATAGVAIVGASLIAITPAALTVPDVQVGRDIALTSALGDALAPWIDQYNTAVENATVLANNYFIAPDVALQQFIANQQGFIQEILSDPSKIPDVVSTMQEHLHAVTNAYTLLDVSATDPITATTILHTLSGSDLSTLNIGHDLLFTLIPALLPALLPAGTDTDAILPIINFLASPMSGMIMGMLGPGLSPWIALLNSINDGDGLSQIMANMTGAFFNGATLDLGFVLPLLGDAVPPGLISHLDFAFGGLLSTGAVGNAPYTFYDAAGDPTTQIPAVGGSIFNSLGISIDASGLGIPLTLDIQSQGVGPIGAIMGWEQTIAGLLGGQPWNWAGKTGTPPAAEPPLSGFSLPTIPSDFFDDGGSGAGGAADVPVGDLNGGDLTADLTALVQALAGSL